MTGRQETFDIQDYMSKGVERVVADAVRATLKNPREGAFMVKFAAASRRASQKRRKAEDADSSISIPTAVPSRARSLRIPTSTSGTPPCGTR